MDADAHKHKRSITGNAFSGHGLYSGADGSKTEAGVRGVYYYNGDVRKMEPVYTTNNPPTENRKAILSEPFDPMVRTCKENKRLVR